jgi:hypothetical protein
MVASMQEGQDMARDLIKMLGERVVDLSKRELPSGSMGNRLDSNGVTQPSKFATHFVTTPDKLATQDEQLDSTRAITPADEHASIS